MIITTALYYEEMNTNKNDVWLIFINNELSGVDGEIEPFRNTH